MGCAASPWPGRSGLPANNCLARSCSQGFAVPSVTGPKNENLTIGLATECAEKARHYYAIVGKGDISEGSDSIL